MDDAGALITRHRLSAADYGRMADAGILGEGDRVELIAGEVIDMAPIGVAHAWTVTRITKALVMACGDRFAVSVQNPVRLDDYNEPQPDFAVLRPLDGSRHPGPADVLLLVEVSDSSLRYDRTVKLPLYARAGIPETWIVDLERRVVDTYRVMAGSAEMRHGTYRAGDTVPLAAAPDIAVAVGALLG